GRSSREYIAKKKKKSPVWSRSRCLLRSLRRRQDESRLNRGGPGGDLHLASRAAEGRGSWFRGISSFLSLAAI
uniref:Uncharacterized protein n=1 Tax=Oryza barthii TaxID=65489 RepID=A0A0D3HDI1_9ORYZ